MYLRHRHKPVESLCAAKVARDIHETACAHVRGPGDRLLRILVYDCRPLAKRVHNPISGRCVDFAESQTFRFRTELHRQLLCLRKVALRYGELADRNRWSIRDRATKRLLNRTLRMEDLHDDDVVYDVSQKGVDTKMSLDIASLAYKRLVDRIVLVTGDSDFVPAAKLARREGLDVVLDPLWGYVAPSLHEHIDGLRTHWPKRTRVTSS
jgi:uncharacterized LabA/DUF88 family protein